MTDILPEFETFKSLANQGANLLPMYCRLMSDQITPVLAYRRLVHADDRMAPSFLFESVVGGDRIGRYSFLGVKPVQQVVARGRNVRLLDQDGREVRQFESSNPLMAMPDVTASWKLARIGELPAFTGGWVGFAGYDTVRYAEGEKLPNPPPDDRGIPDLHMQLYRQIVAFDQVQKTVIVITHVLLDEHDSLQSAYEAGHRQIASLIQSLETPIPRLPNGSELPVGQVSFRPPPSLPTSNMGKGGYQQAVNKAKQYIAAGDIFQVVPSQRFELLTHADPFDIYRALRVVNPSPYMFYLQIEGAILVGSSPEILCRVHDGVITSRPLAGTRRRGRDETEDLALERELLADPKERAEHVMLVDLGRNDVGRVAVPGSVRLPEVLTVERYSHVMHISSTVTGLPRDDCSAWDVLRAILPVGTVSGAPKVRAMQIIDEFETTKRGPYGGAVGHADFTGNMDMAIALRTMVVMPTTIPGRWRVHLQAGGGIVADSEPEAEYEETVNKAAALATAVDLAEKTFG